MKRSEAVRLVRELLRLNFNPSEEAVAAVRDRIHSYTPEDLAALEAAKAKRERKASKRKQQEESGK